ncbi:trimethylamine methyltransferase family protein [Zhaonella formicivorans]|uniref:trimethylamine methyltransferase family protein n=1 Tax=Zhaonella formicivorans TaxID=2528593 RepID=UPI0010D37033|nr:trimethylamine methyltransferase family protein [Zhaonella formicivorans]
MEIKAVTGGSYAPLSEKDIQEIHNATIKIMENTGLEVHYDGALEIFEDGGAKVDYNKKRVYIAEGLLEKCLAAAPSQVMLCGREEKHDLLLSDKNVYLGTGGTALNVLDLDKKRRPSSLQDIADIARLVDALDNISFLVCPVYPNELPKEAVDVNRFYRSLCNTSKHVMGGVYTVEGVRNVIRIAEEIAGGADRLKERPLVSMITCVMSPLKFDENYTKLMVEAAGYGVPLATPAAPMAGATGPMTLAGTLVQLNVEALAGIVLTQLINRGTPVLYSAVPTTVDIRTGTFLFGSIEMGMMNAAAAQLARYYKIPIYATAGVSESKIPDVQAGYEKAGTALLVALAGANYIHDAAGLLESAMTASYAQYVIDNEILGIVLRAARGIEVTPQTLATEVIAEVGPGGEYLTHAHTYRHMRSETFLAKVANRQNFTNWVQEGAINGWEKANRIAAEILQSHRPLPIPADVHSRVQAMIPGLYESKSEKFDIS